MTTFPRLRLTLLTTILCVASLAGCDYDRHPTATGTTVTPPDTKAVGDPGTVNSGGSPAPSQPPR